MSSFGRFIVQGNDGKERSLQEYQGRVILAVNVASECGFTPQYEGLQALNAEFSDRGLSVLGFPCDQFGHQEPGSNQQIQEFCSSRYQVGFPILGKLEVNGNGADPLFAWLKKSAKGLLGTEAIKWNFTKFLIARDGTTVTRHAPQVKPASLRSDILALLD